MDKIISINKLNENEYISNLFHGPTYAFKDYALQFLGNLFSYSLKKNFKIKIIENSSRNPFIFKKLKIMKDDDRWLLMSEGRPCQMSWILCTPKLNS